ncbi:MAG: cadherin-like beta sandwich domain-containing protein [Oscillibacter sp.]|nr:cadherin-like beta sandwich domain-containing protein [Oscillibacter sp.]
MARINALSILLEDEGKAYLLELYNKVIDNVSKSLVSTGLKNMDLSGDPTSGSLEVKRFANATPQDYGTARTAGKGAAVKTKPVVVVIDQDKEIVEEIEEKDIRLFGVDGLLDRRSVNHVQRMLAALDRDFFTAAYNDCTSVTLDLDGAIEDQLETIIQACENTQNAYVDGVDRSLMRLVLNTDYYGRIRTALDKMTRPNVDTTVEEFYSWHGVEVKSCIHLPAGCTYLLMVQGAVAQPVYANPYKAEKIPLSDSYAVELFYHYGTKVVTPDLIFRPVAASSGSSGSSGSGGTSTASARLSALTIGNLSLSPTFNADTTTYAVSTTNSTNTITATAEDSGATITIKNGTTTVANGSAATWEAGENTLTITVANGGNTRTYTITVTKS